MSWDKLSMSERADIIKLAVQSGIKDLYTIRDTYNEFAKGGKKKSGTNLKQNFLTSLDQSLREDATFNTPQYRQFFTDLARQESGYYPTITNSIGAKGYFQLMPGNRSASWSNPTQQFHETYKLVKSNIDYFNKKLTKKDWDRARELGIDMYGLLGGAHLGGVGGVVRALRGKGNAKDMNGSSVLGYMRQFSQSGKPTTYTQAPQVSQVASIAAPIPSTTDSDESYNFLEVPQLTSLPPTTYTFGSLPTVEDIARQTALEPPTPEELRRQERHEKLERFQNVMGLMSRIQPSVQSSHLGNIASVLGQSNPIQYFSDGGSIHIKPSHRGKFTALKERTGHSASWFKENGTPAQKKMATFALNARKWKHGDGGDMHIYNGGKLPEVTVTAYAPLRLTTHYPITSEYYPYTGHSELDIPIDRKTWYDYTGEKIDSDMRFPYVTIDKTSEAKDYNLVTNNCADATLKYLNAAFGTSEKPWLFTTPGDVRDYALKKLNGKLIENNDGSDTVLIPRNAKIAAKLSKTALNMLDSTPEGTAYSSRWVNRFHRHGLGGNLFDIGGPKGNNLWPKNVFNSLKRYVDRTKSNARSAIMRASYVDTRSDTTRKGYHEGRTRYGYNYGANENGITGAIARVIEGKDHNPYLQTGIAPMPDKIASPKDISRVYNIFKKVTPKTVFKKVSKITPELDAAYKEAVESGNRPEALRLLEQAYLNSGVPHTEVTVTPEGNAVGWFHGSEGGNHTVFDSRAMNATIGGASANGRVKGNFLTTDVPSGMRYAGSNRYESANVPEYTSPQTFSEKLKNLFGSYTPRRLYPAERVGEYAPKPERLFDTKGKAPINHLDKVDPVVYPMYVNPGENMMSLDFQGKPWSQAPVKFPNSYVLERKIHTPEKDWINVHGDPVKEYRTEKVPYKTLEEAVEAFTKDPIAKMRPENPLLSLQNQKFDPYDMTREIEGYNSRPHYETVKLIESYTPSTTNGAVQTAAKEGNSSVLMRNVIDSNGGPNGEHYAIDDFVTLKPNQQKLADITYDDNGELIPLSQRFNWSKDDIRWSWLLPIFGVGAGAAAVEE